MVRERSWIRIPLWAQMTLHEGDKSILHLIEEASNHRRKEVEHISLVGLNKEDLDKCLGIYRLTAKRAKFDLHSNQYYYDVFSKLADYSQLFAAYVDDQPIAFLWLAISAETAFELYGGMNDLGQQLRSNYALKWYAIRKCKEWGISRYDFGGLLEGGVTTFKMGWTESAIDLAGTFDKPLSVNYATWHRGLPMAKKTSRRVKKIFRR